MTVQQTGRIQMTVCVCITETVKLPYVKQWCC